jgi:hypothetical protein
MLTLTLEDRDELIGSYPDFMPCNYLEKWPDLKRMQAEAERSV